MGDLMINGRFYCIARCTEIFAKLETHSRKQSATEGTWRKKKRVESPIFAAALRGSICCNHAPFSDISTLFCFPVRVDIYSCCPRIVHCGRNGRDCSTHNKRWKNLSKARTLADSARPV
ncbi:hypothetical protein NPIL_369951 [Nephila pilipes]|uniref:Uncharacterized protein n=1 Tax=Nephila pilipes TaxID=299642 RepID=A0A8X6JQZ1_NEPPI|nr:hypothetical protein NPIL_369951 [Nephila pilipes]